MTYCGACQSHHDPLDFCNIDGRTEPQLTMLQQKAVAKHVKGIPTYVPRINSRTGEPFGWDENTKAAIKTVEALIDRAEEAGYQFGYGQGHDDAIKDAHVYYPELAAEPDPILWEYRVLYLWHGEGHPIMYETSRNLDQLLLDAEASLTTSPDSIMWVEKRPVESWLPL